MPPQPQQPQGLSLIEQYRLAKWAIQFPALTVMVFLRHSIGFRLLNPLVLTSITGVIIFLTGLATPGNEEGRPLDLMGFALLFFLFGVAHRVRGWWQINRNIHQHSRYAGTSVFHFRWVPRFMRRNRRIERFLDPALCMLTAIALLPVSRFLALYLGFAAFCLRFFEFQIHEASRDRDLDILDEFINAQAQAQVVEQFEQPTRPQAPTGAIPSGIGPDIAGRIKRRP